MPELPQLGKNWGETFTSNKCILWPKQPEKVSLEVSEKSGNFSSGWPVGSQLSFLIHWVTLCQKVLILGLTVVVSFLAFVLGD